MLNRIVLIGRIVAEPQLSYTSNGLQIIPILKKGSVLISYENNNTWEATSKLEYLDWLALGKKE